MGARRTASDTAHFPFLRGPDGGPEPPAIFGVEPQGGRITLRISMTCRALFRTLIALSGSLLIASCTEYQTRPPTAAVPTPTPAGYWNGDGVSGSPKIVVSISEQHAYFYKGKHLVGESTVSTGKPGFGTPPGHYTVVSKDKDHVSTVFGDYVDDFGNVVKSNIDSRKDSKPPGSHYDGARMPFAMFFRGGYAMHQGYVPPYAASHGCIRLPQGMAEPFFENAPLGTPVIVKQEAVALPATLPALVPLPPPAPNVVQTTPPAPVRPAPVRTTIPAPTPVLVRAPSPAPLRSPAPSSVRSSTLKPSPTPVRPPSPAPVRPATVRTTVPAPTPLPVRSPSPLPLRSPAPVQVRPANVRTSVPSPTPLPLRKPSVRSTAPTPTPPPLTVRPYSAPPVHSSAPATTVRPAPTPTPTPSRKKHRRVHSRTRVQSPGPSPTPAPTPNQ